MARTNQSDKDLRVLTRIYATMCTERGLEFEDIPLEYDNLIATFLGMINCLMSPSDIQDDCYYCLKLVLDCVNWEERGYK